MSEICEAFLPSLWRPCVALAAAPASAQTKWNLPSAYPNDNPHVENLNAFAKDVVDATGGKLQITVHGGASLFKGPEIKRAVATGQAQMGEVLISMHWRTKIRFRHRRGAVPGDELPAGEEAVDGVAAGDREEARRAGHDGAVRVPWGPQGIYAKKELNTMDDLKGLKWRAYNVGTARIGEMVGAQAVTMQAAELPQALATGVVNSFMSSGATGYDSKVWESLTYFYDTQAWIPKNVTFMNKAAFDALDKPTQDAILKAAKVAEERGWKVWEEKTELVSRADRQEGHEGAEPPSAALEAGFQKIGKQLTADWLKKAGAEGQAVVDAYKKM